MREGEKPLVCCDKHIAQTVDADLDDLINFFSDLIHDLIVHRIHLLLQLVPDLDLLLAYLLLLAVAEDGNKKAGGDAYNGICQHESPRSDLQPRLRVGYIPHRHLMPQSDLPGELPVEAQIVEQLPLLPLALT